MSVNLAANARSKTGLLWFGRQLTEQELVPYRQSVQHGLDALGVKTLAMILPAPAFPVDRSQDIGIGSPLTDKGKGFTRWLSHVGFNALQYLPNGQLAKSDPSPYMSSNFSGNTLLIDLEALTRPEWGKLLSEKTLNHIVQSRPTEETVRVPRQYGLKDNGYTKTRLQGDEVVYYPYVTQRSHEALKEAYNRFKQGADEPVLAQLQQDFQAFCNNPHNRYWLDNDSLYEALCTFYNADRPDQWGSTPVKAGFSAPADPALDKNLFNRHKVSQADAKSRLAVLNADPALVDEQQLHKFKQFVLDRQLQAFQSDNQAQAQQLAQQLDQPEWAQRLTVKPMADGQVAPGARDTWTHPEAFLEDWHLHSPPNVYWGFPVLDFSKITDPDGALGKAGRFIYERFHKLFRDNPGGARVDHAPGLIDPWVAPKGKAADSHEATRLRSSPDVPELRSMSVITESNGITDEHIEAYSQPIAKTIVRAAQENGIPAEQIMFEELDFHSPIPARVMEQNGWSKIQVTRQLNDANTGHIRPHDWATTGNHDFISLREFAESPEGAGQTPQEQFVRLFSTPAKHLQVLFLDALGRKASYSQENTPDAMNWRLRLPDNVEEEYYKALADGHGLNLPEVLSQALSNKGKGNAELNNTLQHFAKILKEPVS